MQKFHKSQEESRRNTRACRRPLEEKIYPMDWLWDASRAKVLVKAVGANLHICLFDYIMRENCPNYECKTGISSAQDNEVWMVQQVYAKESFSGIQGFLHADYVMQCYDEPYTCCGSELSNYFLSLVKRQKRFQNEIKSILTTLSRELLFEFWLPWLKFYWKRKERGVEKR